jgi:hypothetical protein
MRSWHYSSSTTPTRQKASPASTWAGLFVPLLANSTPVLITSPLTTSWLVSRCPGFRNRLTRMAHSRVGH